MAYVRLTTGGIVAGWTKESPSGELTLAQAERSAAERNARAIELGIEARYEATEEEHLSA